MFIHRFYLRGFKPLLHGGIREIDATNLEQITFIYGENGKGKSSILRELTPYPATRTDYEKNGQKLLEITHGKHEFVLISDFSKTGAHSFIKDGVNLNISGTTDVQENLVEQHFGFSKLIDRLLSCQCKISSMGKPDRKNLIMSTYPSSLLFILDHHKNVCSRIRTCNNQLKLMQDRRLHLKNKLIAPNVLKQYYDFKDDLAKAMLALDQDIYMLTQTLKTYQDKAPSEKLQYNSTDDFMEACDTLLEGFNKDVLSRELYFFIEPRKLDRAISKLHADIAHTKNDIAKLYEEASDVRSTIEEYQNYLKNDNETAIKECQLLIDTQNDIITQHGNIDYNVPLIQDENELNTIKDSQAWFKELLEYLKSFNCVFWHDHVFDRFYQLISTYRSRISSYNKDISEVAAALERCTKKQKNFVHMTYPKDCKRECAIRTEVQSVHDSLNMEMDSLSEKLNRLYNEKDHYLELVKRLENKLEGRGATRPYIGQFIDFISRYHWGKFICSSKDPIRALNSNISNIWNNFRRVITESESNLKVKKAKEMLVGLEAKLLSLKTSKQPVTQFITKSLVENELKLDKLIQKINDLKEWQSFREEEHDGAVYHLQYADKIVALNEQWKLFIERKVHESDMDFIKQILNEMSSTKKQIYEKLSEIESVIKEQESYLVRLKDEVEPNIAIITEELNKLTLVEEQLSPTSGLPHRYIIRYLNAIFLLANKFIERVWNYDMKLAYFDEEEDFDYVFKIILNENSEVKDVNICSTGQKAIIDLAVTLSICVYRGYAQIYPIKCDEVDAALTPTHRDKLTYFLGELLHQKNIMQTFIVNHYLALSSAFNEAGIVLLSEDGIYPENCTVKGVIKH